VFTRPPYDAAQLLAGRVAATDQLAKLWRDYERFRCATDHEGRTDALMDFATTSASMLEWVFPKFEGDPDYTAMRRRARTAAEACIGVFVMLEIATASKHRHTNQRPRSYNLVSEHPSQYPHDTRAHFVTGTSAASFTSGPASGAIAQHVIVVSGVPRPAVEPMHEAADYWQRLLG
jgi:hypothetical protein